MDKQNNSIQSLQQQLEKHQNTLNYLEEQEAHFGPLAVPETLHNQLLKERRIIATLTRRLQGMRHIQSRPNDIGARLKALAKAHISTVAAVDNDEYWYGIIAEVGAAFNLPTETYSVAQMIENLSEFGQAGHKVAVIGLPMPSEFSHTVNLTTWTRAIVAISRHMPTILLTPREARSVAIATRYAMLRHNSSPVATIQKETFTYDWFTKMFKKGLERGGME